MLMSNENLNELWSRAKDLLKEETTVITYQTWIQPLELKSVRDNVIVLVASNSFQKDTIESTSYKYFQFYYKQKM